MALANISLSDTFTTWVSRFNQLLTVGNLLTYGQANSTGTLTLSNAGYLNGNVSLNVSNGVIQVKGNTFDANAITLTSNSQTLSITGSGKLGTTIYFNISALSTNVNDANTGNIASANSVNTAYAHVSDAFVWANTLAASSNAWTNTSVSGANAWSNAVFSYANTRMESITAANAVSANAWTNTSVAGANAWTNAVFGYANTRMLANSSGAVFQGNLNITGNVGIGTISPTIRLQVTRPSGNSSTGEVYAGDGTQWWQLNSNSSSGSYNPLVQTSDHSLIYSNGGSESGTLVIGQWSASAKGIRIDSGGNLGVGLAVPAAKVHAAGDIFATGDVVSAYSDIRLKDVSGPIINALDKVNQIETFYYKPNQMAIDLGVEKEPTQKIGMSAQQLQEILPEVVREAPVGQGYLTIQYERVVPLLIEAIKELKAEVDRLNKKED